MRRLAEDIWETTKAGHPVAIHIGEGINHYFHATLHNRATYLPMLLTGNIGKHGAGVYTWAGNYKGALLQGSSWSGPGAASYTAEDPFHPVLDDKARITHENILHTSDGEDPSYWACGEKVLAAETREGRKVFTGKTHLPTPTKAVWYNNANFLNQAKWVYNIIVNNLPKMDLIVDQQIEWTGSAEYADVVLPVNSWVEFQDLEMGASCSNPFLQVWQGGSSRSTTRATTARSSPGWPGRWPPRPATGGSPTTSSSSPRRGPRSTSSACSTTARPRGAPTGLTRSTS